MSVAKTYQEFIYKRTYSRFLPDEGRRERWKETVDRYNDFFIKRVPNDTSLLKEMAKAMELVENKQVMPSMRALWTAGPALERENIAGYNCAYTVIDCPKAFAEVLYILMNGTGVGFSVERQYVSKLPEIPELKEDSSNVIVFEDSKLGWAEGYLKVLNLLYDGFIPVCDYSLIRPKGSMLKTFGGRASGPEPLKQLVDFTIKTFKNAQGRKLNSLEVYDIVCMIANTVVVGGVRRSATLSLSNLSDTRMRDAKQGEFWLANPQRTLSNNSVAYTEKPDAKRFMEEWLALMKSGTGERGIVNREAMKKACKAIGRDSEYDFGVNPCGEIVLRPKQFCNLTEVVIRPNDNFEDLVEKVKAATLLGVLQSTLTDFNFLDEEWKKNVEEERLLGVSLTGLADHPVLSKISPDAKGWLKALREIAHNTAKEWANALGINVPKAITTVKPSGTVSQLVDASSGLHPRYSPYYIRRVRVNTSDPICKLLMAKNVPCHPEVGQTWEDCNTVVFEFPMKSPEGSVCRKDVTAIEQLEYWKMLKTYWTDHNPDVTIYVKDDEWLEVGAWVFKNWDLIAGVSFLPYDGGVYQLAPYEEITKEQYEELVKQFPKDIDFEELSKYEKQDQTQGSREYACVAGACEI